VGGNSGVRVVGAMDGDDKCGYRKRAHAWAQQLRKRVAWAGGRGGVRGRVRGGGERGR